MIKKTENYFLLKQRALRVEIEMRDMMDIRQGVFGPTYRRLNDWQLSRFCFLIDEKRKCLKQFRKEFGWVEYLKLKWLLL